MEDKVKEKICSIASLNRAFKKRKSCRMWKPSVMDYYLNMVRYNYILSKQLMDDTYKVRPCYHFHICDPKPREIEAPHLKDGIIQSSVNNNYLHEKLRPILLKQNCACQIGKGTDYARNLFKEQLRRHYRKYGREGICLKIDLKSFFASIDGNSLHALNEKYIQHPWVIKMIEDWGVKAGSKGLGLGAETNQTESCLALHPVDTFFTTVLSLKYYVRYQDDIMVILPSRKKAEETLTKLSEELKKYALSINKKKTQIYTLNHPLPFLGFNFTLLDGGKVIMKIQKEKIRREKRKLRNQLSLSIPSNELWDSYTSWRASALKGDNYFILQRMEDYAMEVKRVDRKDEMQREIAIAQLSKLNATIEYLALMADVDISEPTTTEVTA